MKFNKKNIIKHRDTSTNTKFYEKQATTRIKQFQELQTSPAFGLSSKKQNQLNPNPFFNNIWSSTF